VNCLILPPAELELDEAYQYYETQNVGLGKEFIKAFESTTRLLSTTPFAWRLISKRTRRININRFPYLVLYIIEDKTIIITCIAHQHKNPNYYLTKSK